jgi:ATP-dependent Lon protease
VRRLAAVLAAALAFAAPALAQEDDRTYAVPGRGKLILTGNLGATLKESAQTALSCVRARARDLGLSPRFHERVDIHLHIPEEILKDGPGRLPSLALVSALTEADPPGRPDRG